MWIISEGGIVIFSRVYEEMLDDQLFGALLTALNSFAEQIAQTGLSNFELGEKRFTILKRSHFVFIANSDKKIKPKKVVQELQAVMDIFFTVYSKETIDNWGGEVTIFSNFEREIEDSLDDPIKKMEKAFW